MSILERIFKKHPFVFLALTFVFAGFIGSAFQEIGNAITHMIVQIPILNTWGGLILGWLIVISFMFVFFYLLEKILIGIWKTPKFECDVVNDEYARILVFNKDKTSLDECKCQLVGFHKLENIDILDFQNKYFSWSNKAYRDGGQQVTGIPIGHEALLDIATIKNGKMVFAFAYDHKEYNFEGRYELVIEFSGTRYGYEFSKPRNFILEWDGKKLEIKPK